MILEVAILNVKKDPSECPEACFQKVQNVISLIKGYLLHKLKRCIEQNHKYILLVNGETLEDHEIGFRKSKKH